jgi:peptide deformylase
MALLPILVYPNPTLKQISKPIETFDVSLEEFIGNLCQTLDSFPGCVGIAAPQVGELIRLVVVDASRNQKCKTNSGRQILINPVLVFQEGAEIAREGCLSLPDFTANVVRAKTIEVNALDQFGQARSVKAIDFEARLILHEMDHLDGLLFLDRVASLKSDVFRRKRYLHDGAGAKQDASPNQKSIESAQN